MKTSVFGLLIGCCLIAFGGCQGKGATSKAREFSPEQEALYQELSHKFTRQNFERLVKDRAAVFDLFLVDGPRQLVNGVWRGTAGRLFYNDRRNGGRGFSMELSTSMFPVLSLSVSFTEVGLEVRYWSQDFVSSNERLTQEEINKYSVYRDYEGVLPKDQFLKVLKDRLLLVYKFDEKSMVEQNFYVMRVAKEQKSRPQQLQ